jgi:hypothetical protein
MRQAGGAGLARTASCWANIAAGSGGSALTPARRETGAGNVLAVRVDNFGAGGRIVDIRIFLPLFGDFFVHGGLYRPVRLVSTAPLHVDMNDFMGRASMPRQP